MLAQNQTQERQTELGHGPTRYGTCYGQCDAANKLQTLDYTGTSFFTEWVIYRFNNITGITIKMLKTTDTALRQRQQKCSLCTKQHQTMLTMVLRVDKLEKGWHSI